MERNDYGKPKYYVVTFSSGRIKPKIVCGWPAVLEQRKRTKGKVGFKVFHTYEGAEKYILELLRLR